MCRQPQASSSAPTIGSTGRMTQARRASALSPIVIMSKRPNGVGRRPGPRLASQLRVKLGMTRPPISAIRVITTAMPARVEYSASPEKCASRWNARFPAARSVTIATILKLSHLRPAMISRAAAMARSARNATSIAAAGPHPIQADMLTAIRPATQTENRPISGSLAAEAARSNWGLR